MITTKAHIEPKKLMLGSDNLIEMSAVNNSTTAKVLKSGFFMSLFISSPNNYVEM